jgi:hypothetical protein
MRNGETAPNFAPEHLIAARDGAVEFLPQAFNALISASRFAAALGLRSLRSTLLPVLPPSLTMISLEDLLDRLLKLVL